MDFSSLVLGPCMAVFGRPFTVLPVKSNPTGAAYEAEGIYGEQPVDIATEDGAILSSSNKTLGIRLADFEIPPIPGDRVQMDGVTYVIDDTDDDGQGGSVLALKARRGP